MGDSGARGVVGVLAIAERVDVHSARGELWQRKARALVEVGKPNDTTARAR